MFNHRRPWRKSLQKIDIGDVLAQTKKGKNRYNDHDGTDDIDDIVHWLVLHLID